MSKALDISSATARIAPVLSKVLAILSDAIFRGSAVDLEDVMIFKDFTNRRNKNNGR